MRIKEKNQEIIIGEKIHTAEDIFSRIKGLMFRKDITGDGLLIRPCCSIHTFFMKFPIDAVFLDKSGKIIKILKNLRPWRISWFYPKANQVLELKAGTLPPAIKEGDVLILCSN
ncbi:MAG: DUF192 domain-containing protein [Halobacteriovoraceae bacterium]|nr:DUF192 domain-containing protein [Halobacteriovoraceae bacterium]